MKNNFTLGKFGIKITILIIILNIIVGLTSCSFKATQGKAVNMQFDVSTDLLHETGTATDDGSWGAGMNQEPKGRLAYKEDVELEAGAYTFSFLMLIDFIKINDATLMEFQVIDQQNDKTIYAQQVKRYMFDKAYKYKQFDMDFTLEKKSKYTISLVWTQGSVVQVSKASLISTKKNLVVKKQMNIINKILATPASEKAYIYNKNVLYYFDLLSLTSSIEDSAIAYDCVNLVSSIQGLVNRDAPHLFVNALKTNTYSSATDEFWFKELRKPGGNLEKKEIITIKSISTLLKLFKTQINGFVIWDENVPATVNVATTACGIENVIPLRYSEKPSLYQKLVKVDKVLPVKLDLYNKFTGKGIIPDTKINSTGSAKNDAYLWAKAKYLDTKKANSTLMAWYVDAYSSSRQSIRYDDLENCMLSNRDYYILNKAFIFDLNIYPDQITSDDPNQKEGTDFNTLTAILKKENENAGDKPITIAGFVPWNTKYTSFVDPTLPDPVPTEWYSVRLFSTYNAMLDADIGMSALANASVYTHFPVQASYKQNVKKTPVITKAENKNYIMFYMGDYDSATWLNTCMIDNWMDPNRGKIPLMWPINAILAKRVPHVLDYMYKTQSSNDYFVTGDNGMGYLNPLSFDISGRDKSLNGSLDSWIKANELEVKRFDLDIMGFMCTDAPVTKKIQEAYAKILPVGMMGNFQPESNKVGNTPALASYSPDGSIARDVALTAKKIVETLSETDEPVFNIYRIIVANPKFALDVYEKIIKENPELKVEILDPYTFYSLYGKSLE